MGRFSRRRSCRPCRTSKRPFGAPLPCARRRQATAPTQPYRQRSIQTSTRPERRVSSLGLELRDPCSYLFGLRRGRLQFEVTLVGRRRIAGPVGRLEGQPMRQVEVRLPGGQRDGPLEGSERFLRIAVRLQRLRQVELRGVVLRKQPYGLPVSSHRPRPLLQLAKRAGP